ncbi:hypothetical protein [Streptantibioticus ferralitis]|uniref:Uncharacterized protein n=1 Tax=Streptantibioticus ferralitis TaxID=236510 RepID=A0ABT5YY09_9ACTN|nr:hypothetical protein [Streptantibioticus ferralitis]MDF2256292.1 hypothetical protein [Streptantibioticus ferralitis]
MPAGQDEARQEEGLLHGAGRATTWRTGPYLETTAVRAAMRLADKERLLGFLYVGRPDPEGRRGPRPPYDPADHLSVLPYAVFGIPSGVLLDRMDLRRTMARIDYFRCAVMLAFALLVASTAGPVRSLDWTARIEALPTLVALAHGLRPGQLLETTTDLVGSPGYVYPAAEDPRDAERDYRALRAMEADGLYTR